MTKYIEQPINTDMKIIFGDFTMATLKGLSEKKSKGIINLVFIPDNYMRHVHQIQDEEYDQIYGVIKKSYPTEYCHCVIKDPKFQTWILLCDYNGILCDPSYEINMGLLRKCKIYKDELEVWKISASIRFLKLKKRIGLLYLRSGIRFPPSGKIFLIIINFFLIILVRP